MFFQRRVGSEGKPGYSLVRFTTNAVRALVTGVLPTMDTANFAMELWFIKSGMPNKQRQVS